VGLARLQLPEGTRRLMEWFGVRGIASVYYLMHSINEGLSAPFARELTAIVLAVLLIVGVLALLQNDGVLAGIIWSIVVVNTVLSFWREYRAEQAIEKLREILPSFAHIARDGVESYIPASEVVPGDVLVLAEGDNITADARVIEEYGLQTNNATLTGEAIPARKTADSSHQTGISELDRPNLIFAGTSIASGTGRAVVYSTGMMTQFGRIAHLTQSIAEEPTPFQKELNHLSKFTAWIAAGIGAVVAVVGYFSLGFPFKEAILLAVFDRLLELMCQHHDQPVRPLALLEMGFDNFFANSSALSCACVRGQMKVIEIISKKEYG
jgi:magnesium-transporting ATPase (P-type)